MYNTSNLRTEFTCKNTDNEVRVYARVYVRVCSLFDLLNQRELLMFAERCVTRVIVRHEKNTSVIDIAYAYI